MNSYIIQLDKIVSWTQIKDLDTLIEFYVNCYCYLPELFIGATVFASAVGLYVAFHKEEIKYYIRIAILAIKMRNK